MGFFKDTVDVPALGRHEYRAILHRCKLCGAVVNRSDRDLHEEWHKANR